MKNWVKTSISFCCLFLLLCSFGVAQTVTLEGKVIATNDVSGIHVINTTQKKFTITNERGEFTMMASLNDSIYFSALQFEPLTVIVDTYTMTTERLLVELKDRVNELDEVVIGQVLTGDLRSDLENSKAKAELNFYDLGIPGYTGKRKTQNERRLFEADAGKFVYYYGLAMSININKILNRISGRTKKLKQIVRLESQDLCMQRAKSYFSESLFNEQEVPEIIVNEFFYYASEDPKFLGLCQLNNDMKFYEFLVSKLIDFNSDSFETDE